MLYEHQIDVSILEVAIGIRSLIVVSFATEEKVSKQFILSIESSNIAKSFFHMIMF